MAPSLADARQRVDRFLSETGWPASQRRCRLDALMRELADVGEEQIASLLDLLGVAGQAGQRFRTSPRTRLRKWLEGQPGATRPAEARPAEGGGDAL